MRSLRFLSVRSFPPLTWVVEAQLYLVLHVGLTEPKPDEITT